MISRVLFFCLSVALSPNALGFGLGSSLDFMKPGMRWECEAFEFLGDYDHIRLLGKAKKLGDGCEKAEIYHNIVYDIIHGPHTSGSIPLSKPMQKIEREARFSMIETLSVMIGKRKDNYEIINQANRYLLKYGDEDPLAFRVHYYLVSAVKRGIRSARKSQHTNLMAIGEHPRQQEFFVRTQVALEDGELVIEEAKIANDKGDSAFSANMLRMSLQSFVDNYDDRVSDEDQQLVDQVKSWVDEAQSIYADHFIVRGDYYLEKNEPFAAASWYTQLTRKGPYTDSRGKKVYILLDKASVKVAWAYLVAAQNFAGVRPSIEVGDNLLKKMANDISLGFAFGPLKTGASDFTRWLQLEEKYNPNHPDHLSRAEMAELAYCSAASVYSAAVKNRPRSSISSELLQLPARLEIEKNKIENAIGKKVSCN